MLSKQTENVIKQLKKANLSLEDRTALTTAILNKLDILPLNDSILFEGQTIAINGKQLELDQFIAFKDSAIALKDNVAFKLINEQVRYLATNLGIYKATALDQVFFYKAGLWVIAEYNRLIDRVIDTER